MKKPAKLSHKKKRCSWSSVLTIGKKAEKVSGYGRIFLWQKKVKRFIQNSFLSGNVKSKTISSKTKVWVAFSR